MKILHIYKSYYPETLGGIESFIETLSLSLKKQGIHSSLLTTTVQKKRIEKSTALDAIYYYPSNITIASCPISLSLLKDFSKIIEPFDVLHYHFPWPLADLAHLLSKTKKPSIVTYHSDIIKQKIMKYAYEPLMHRFLQKMQMIVATSPNYLKTSPVLQRYPDKTSVITVGVDKTQLSAASSEVLQYWKNRIPENFFLFVGVLRYYKGLSFLLEAIAGSTIPVVITGAGPEERALKKMVEEKKITSVIFIGRVDDAAKSALYQLCRAVVVPSHLRSEALCISLIEGLMFQKPLISAEIGTGTSFVNQHDFSGIVVPPADPAALRCAMQRLLSDESYYQKLRANTLIQYKNHFTIEMMTEKYTQLYRTI